MKIVDIHHRCLAADTIHRAAVIAPDPPALRPAGKATTAIAKSAGRVVESLNVAGMIRNRRLARAIADAGMSGFLSKLEYKCLRLSPPNE